MRVIGLGIAFLLELAVLIALGYWGFQLSGAVRWPAGLGTPILFAVLWGLLAAPKASRPLHGAPNVAFQIGWFACGAAALILAGRTLPGVILAVVYAVNSVLLLATRD